MADKITTGGSRPLLWINRDRLERIKAGHGDPWVYSSDQSHLFECVPLYDHPAPSTHLGRPAPVRLGAGLLPDAVLGIDHIESEDAASSLTLDNRNILTVSLRNRPHAGNNEGSNRETSATCCPCDPNNDPNNENIQSPENQENGRPATNGSQPPCAIVEGVADDEDLIKGRSLRGDCVEPSPQNNVEGDEASRDALKAAANLMLQKTGWKPGDKFSFHSMSELMTALAFTQVKLLTDENVRLRKMLAGCDWFWPEDDTSSDACSDGPWQIAENCDVQPGEVFGDSRGGVVETRYYGFLEAAEDSGSDDQFEADEPTREAAEAMIAAELERRAATTEAS